MKRCIDILGSLFGLIIFAPILILIWILVLRNLGRPALFVQTRPGLRGTPFKMVKFRSMLDTLDVTVPPLSDADRLTPFGSRLRATSADELPEFWNVLKGDMSLVGPRPLLMEYLPLYSQEQSRRMDVRPGITGWAQIKGRNSLNWDEKFALDLWYVDNRSFGLDLKIIWMTLHKVIKKDDISADGQATMAKFTGSNKKS